MSETKKLDAYCSFCGLISDDRVTYSEECDECGREIQWLDEHGLIVPDDPARSLEDIDVYYGSGRKGTLEHIGHDVFGVKDESGESYFVKWSGLTGVKVKFVNSRTGEVIMKNYDNDSGGEIKEERIPIDFHAIAEETGVIKGKVCYSPTFGWGVEGHPTVDFCLIDPPYNEGYEFDGGVVEGVRIENNEWVLRIRKP